MISTKKISFFLIPLFLISCERQSSVDAVQILEICIPKMFKEYNLKSIELKGDEFKGIRLPVNFFHIVLKNQSNTVSTNYIVLDGNLYQLGKSEDCVLFKQEYFLTPKNEVITNLNGYYKNWNSLQKITYLSNRNLSSKKLHSSYFNPNKLEDDYCD